MERRLVATTVRHMDHAHERQSTGHSRHGRFTPGPEAQLARANSQLYPALRRNQTVKTSVNHLFLVAFCPFGDYPFAPRHFPKVRGVARATIISLSDLVLVGACIHR